MMMSKELTTEAACAAENVKRTKIWWDALSADGRDELHRHLESVSADWFALDKMMANLALCKMSELLVAEAKRQ